MSVHDIDDPIWEHLRRPPDPLKVAAWIYGGTLAIVFVAILGLRIHGA